MPVGSAPVDKMKITGVSTRASRITSASVTLGDMTNAVPKFLAT